MLKIAVFFILTFPIFALGCPMLVGNYKACISTTGQQSNYKDVQFIQGLRGSVVVYEVKFTDEDTGEAGEETYIADGKFYTVSESDPDSGTVIEIKSKTSCSGNQVNYRQKFSLNNEIIADVTRTITKSGNIITQKYSGTMNNEPFTDTVTCE